MTWELSDELQDARRAVDESAAAFLAVAQSPPAELTAEQKGQLEAPVEEIAEAVERSRAIEAFVADGSSWGNLADIDGAIGQATAIASFVPERLRGLMALGFEHHASAGLAFWQSWIAFRAELIVNRNACKARSDAAIRALSRRIPPPPGFSQIWASDTARFRQEANELNARSRG
jgi:hypothetical protein